MTSAAAMYTYREFAAVSTPKPPRWMARPMYINPAVTASDSIKSWARAFRLRHSNTVSVASREMPTSEPVEVSPWKTASKPRFAYAGTPDSGECNDAPAGSVPHTNHHHADARPIGMTAIAAASHRLRMAMNSNVPTMKKGPKPEEDTATKPATAPMASR